MVEYGLEGRQSEFSDLRSGMTRFGARLEPGPGQVRARSSMYRDRSRQWSRRVNNTLNMGTRLDLIIEANAINSIFRLLWSRTR